MFSPIYEIPKEISTSGAAQDETLSSEYPVPIALDADTWLVSDGRLGLHLVRATRGPDQTLRGTLLASYDYGLICGTEGVPSPLHLHCASLTAKSTITAVISHRAKVTETGSQSKKNRSSTKTLYDVEAVIMTIPEHSEEAVQGMEVKWRRRGDSVPLRAAYDPHTSAHVLIGGSPYYSEHDTQNPNYQPSADEIAPTPRAGESLDGDADVNHTAVDSVSPARPPPYSWTQTSDSVTIAFPLPASTPSSTIKVTIKAKHLSLLVQRPLLEKSDFPIPRYLTKEWWADVDASSSFWTWDKEGDRQKGEDGNATVGLLTLHLEKKHEGTRWSHVFQSVGTQTAAFAAAEDVEVPETVDPSEMWHIRESLEKYTAALSEGKDVSGLGLGTGVSSLGQGEYDEEVDAAAGTPFTATWVMEDNSTPLETDRRSSEESLLSIEMPRSRTETSQPPSLVIKHDIDGVLLEPPPGLQGTFPWIHSSTFSALSFVLASKRDLRFVFHIDSRVVLAFEGTTRTADSGGNVYIYRRPESLKARQAQQAVLKIGGGDAGTLLGVCAVADGVGQQLIVCLCEKQLIAVSGVI